MSNMSRDSLPRVEFALTAILAGSVTGMTSGWLGKTLIMPSSVTSAILWLLAASVTLLYCTREFGLLSIWIPQRKWQIPAQFVQGSLHKAAIVWGTTLGCGWLTYLKFPAYLVLQLMIFCSGSVSLGALAGALYGLGRSILVLSNPSILSRGLTDRDYSTGIRRVATFEPAIHFVNAWVLLFTSAVLWTGVFEDFVLLFWR